jgi:hypothetical protein
VGAAVTVGKPPGVAVAIMVAVACGVAVRAGVPDAVTVGVARGVGVAVGFISAHASASSSFFGSPDCWTASPWVSDPPVSSGSVQVERRGGVANARATISFVGSDSPPSLSMPTIT